MLDFPLVRFPRIAYSRSSNSLASCFCQQIMMSLTGIISEMFRNYDITFELSDFKDTTVNKQGHRNARKKLSQTYQIALYIFLYQLQILTISIRKPTYSENYSSKNMEVHKNCIMLRYYTLSCSLKKCLRFLINTQNLKYILDIFVMS